MNRVERLTGILLALQTGRQTAAALAARFEVSRRTILRDIDALGEIGVPVVALPGAGGGYELAAGFSLPPLHLTPAEATVLLLALRQAGPASTSPFGAARQSVEEKLRASLRPDVLRQAEHELATVDVAPPPAGSDPAIFAIIRTAIAAGTWLEISYQSLRRVAVHQLLPRRLQQRAGHWYCVAVSLAASEERNYRLDRIAAIRPIAPPPGAETATEAAARPRRDYHDLAHPEIVATLTYRGRQLAADQLPADHLVAGDDGVWQVRFRCPPGELAYYARLFYGLGPDATVLAPPALVEGIYRLAHETARHYEAAAKGDRQVSPMSP